MLYITIYPTYKILDEVIGDSESFTLFLDIRNAMTGLYREEALKSMLNENGIRDLLLSVLGYIEFVYRYAANKRKRPHIVIFYDVGKSEYHRNIMRSYKSNRDITSYKVLSLTEAETIWDNVRIALDMIYKSFSKLYNVHVIRLKYLESDFVPYFFMKNNIIKTDKFLTISSDKDMIQNLEFENSFLLSNGKYGKQLFTYRNWYNKINLYPETHIDVRHFVFFLSIVGDTSDGIKGVKGVGMKGMINIVKHISKNTEIDFTDTNGYIDSIIDGIDNAPKSVISKLRKIDSNRDIVSRNFKLISYKELIRNLSFNQISRIKTDMFVEKLGFKQTIMEMRDLKDYLGTSIIE